jgi:drug/metabolite transporter (DMT)-like permease
VIAAAVIRVIAATLPAGVRDRYREEWVADAAGARELDVSPWSVVGGALGVAAGIDREDPAVSGMSPRRLMFRRLRVALATLTTALLLLVFGVMWGIWSPMRSAATLAESPLTGRVLLVLVIVSGAVALIAIVGVLRARHRARGTRRWGAADVAVAVTLPLAIVATVFVPFVSAPLVFAGLIAILVLLIVEDPRPQQPPLRRRAAVLLAVFSGLSVLAALAGSLLHVYLWNPLARLPGMTLDEIYAGLAAARELPSPVLPVAWAMLWCLAALALVVLAALPFPRIRRLATARRIAGAGILGVALVAGGSWIVGFSMGMGMADAFMTTGGDAAISGPILALIGLVYLVAALLIGLLPSRIRSPHVRNAGEFAASP